jgi:hypothetical protein
MADLSPEKCIICRKDSTDKLSTVTTKGMISLKLASETRREADLRTYLELDPQVVLIHESCRKWFTDKRILDRFSAGVAVDEEPGTSKKLRSTTTKFNWKQMCFFCGKSICLDTNPAERRSVETCELRQSTLAQCRMRADLWSLEVRGRLESCIDLPAEEAVYHKACHTRFICNRPIPGSTDSDKAGRPADKERLNSFKQLCDWLETCENAIFTLDELQDKMISCTDSGAVYSSKYLKKKLIENYGTHIYFAEVCGRKNVLCFKDMCSFIINDKWYKQNKADSVVDESMRIVKAAAKLILAQIQEMPNNMDTYPTAADITDEEKNQVPPLLQVFMESIVQSQLKQNAIGQLIVQAVRPQGILMPIPFGLGVEMDHVFGSKFLISELARLGLSISYDEVIRFKQSVLSSIALGDVSNETLSSASFTQWVADNVDHNIRTIDGYGTFHGMGIISASVFKRGDISIPQTPIIRLKKRLAVADVVKDRGIKIVPYTLNPKCGLSGVTFASVRQLRQPLPVICHLNTVFHAAYFRTGPDVRRPNWSGYMQNTCVGEHDPAAVITMLPIIDLSSSNESCIFSTLLFVTQQATKLNVVVPCITFDQPLWLKAVEIVRASGLKVVVRLGGFHTLMSFLGSIGTVMGGSGIEDALQVIYGTDTVSHMLSGRAVSRAIRGHFLLDSALSVLLLVYLFHRRVKRALERNDY